MDKVYKEDLLDKGKYVLQTINEKWDSQNEINKTGIVGIAAVLSLILFSKFSILIIITALTIQRICYYGKFFTDDSQMPDTVDEDSKGE